MGNQEPFFILIPKKQTTCFYIVCCIFQLYLTRFQRKAIRGFRLICQNLFNRFITSKSGYLLILYLFSTFSIATVPPSILSSRHLLYTLHLSQCSINAIHPQQSVSVLFNKLLKFVVKHQDDNR